MGARTSPKSPIVLSGALYDSHLAHGRARTIQAAALCVSVICLLLLTTGERGVLIYEGDRSSLHPWLWSRLSSGGRQLSPGGPPCDLHRYVNNSVFMRNCTLLEDVCVDQGTIILYDPKYRPRNGNGPPKDIPDLTPDSRQSHFYLPYRGSNGLFQNLGLQPIHARPASSAESRPYLQDPVFSTCTVPVVYFQHHCNNFAHTLRDNAGRMYSALKETEWAEHLKLVLPTGDGLAMSHMNQQLWQPLSNMRVDSWADFSARLTGPQADRATPGPFPASYEGKEQRCFKHMFVCTRDIKTDTWQLHAYGQYLVRYYNGEQLVQTRQEQQPPPQLMEQLRQQGVPPPRQLPVSLLRLLGSPSPFDAEGTLANGLGGGSDGSVPLRVVFQKRDGNDRQLVNAGELMQACNRWQYTSPSGVRVRGLCWEASMDSLEAGIAAAQQADIMVGIHGANMANGWLMRPGSSVIELTMFEFEETEGHCNYAKRNFADEGTQVQYWKLMLCDSKNSWTPSSFEEDTRKAGVASHPLWAKLRNSIVRWEALQTVLEAVVDTGGDMKQYRQRWQDGRWWWLSSADATVNAGTNLTMTCRQARAQGWIV